MKKRFFFSLLLAFQVAGAQPVFNCRGGEKFNSLQDLIDVKVHARLLHKLSHISPGECPSTLINIKYSDALWRLYYRDIYDADIRWRVKALSVSALQHQTLLLRNAKPGGNVHPPLAVVRNNQSVQVGGYFSLEILHSIVT